MSRKLAATWLIALTFTIAGCPPAEPTGGGMGNDNAANDNMDDGTLNDNMGDDAMNDNIDDDTVNDNVDDDTVNDNVDDDMMNDNMDDDVDDTPDILFVVNNGRRVTSYLVETVLNGEIAPLTLIEAGASTSLFQPGPIVVTNSELLLVGRQNGGIVGYEDAFTTNDAPADRIIDGNNTLLDGTNSFAYDSRDDRLYVGAVPANDGILVFDNVSDLTFDGDIAPDRTFGPSDRVPFGTGSISMSPRAMCFDSVGDLYVADTSGLSDNQSRILVFARPETADDLVLPTRTFTSESWVQLEDIEIDSNDVFYAVDGEATVFIFADATILEGTVVPSTTLEPNTGNNVSLEGIEVAPDGTGYLSNSGSQEIYTYLNIAARAGSVVPASTLSGSDTRLSSPQHMFYIER